jgi:hypothetical protein
MSAEPSDPEAWARESIHWVSRKRGHFGRSWVAQIRVDGLVFEGQAEGPIEKRDALRKRAAEAVVSDYMEFRPPNRIRGRVIAALR